MQLADEKYKTLESFNSKVYVARTDLILGQDVTMDDFEMVIFRTTVDKEDIMKSRLII